MDGILNRILDYSVVKELPGFLYKSGNLYKIFRYTYSACLKSYPN